MKIKKALQLKEAKLLFTGVIFATSLLIPACKNSSETGETGTNANAEVFDLFKSMSEVRTSPDPQKAFLEFKEDKLKQGEQFTLQYFVDYVDTKKEKPEISLKLVKVNGEQLTFSGDGNLSEAENTLITSVISLPETEVKKIARPIKAGLNFLNTEDNTNLYINSPEFLSKLKEFNKQFGYDVLSPSAFFENNIAYILTGDYKYWDVTNSYSTEEKFEKSKYSDEKELATIKFFVNELESGTLNTLLKKYNEKKFAIIDYAEADSKGAINPNTILTITSPITSANFQGPMVNHKLGVNYATLELGIGEPFKIDNIAIFNKAFTDLIKASVKTTNGMEKLKEKIAFYEKNKPVNDPNAEAEKDNSWEKNIE
jgi:hypothetical protein